MKVCFRGGAVWMCECVNAGDRDLAQLNCVFTSDWQNTQMLMGKYTLRVYEEILISIPNIPSAHVEN